MSTAGPPGGIRVRPAGDPLRLAVSGGLWAGAGYLLVYLLTGWLLFSLVLTMVTTAAGLAVTIAGVPLLIAAAGVIGGCANAERVRLRTVLAQPVRGGGSWPSFAPAGATQPPGVTSPTCSGCGSR